VQRFFVYSVIAALAAGIGFGSGLVLVGGQATAEKTAVITVYANEPQGTIDPLIFGHFTEETLTSYEGGISSELLFNRKFEMPEERKPADSTFIGTGSGWEPVVLNGSVTLVQDLTVFYSPSCSQRITHGGGNVPAGIQQGGYQYVSTHMSPHQHLSNPFHFRPGERYRVRLAIKNKDLHGAVYVALGESYQKTVAKQTFPFTGGEDWKVYQCELVPSAEATNGKFMVYIDSPGTVWIDSVSMVRADLDEDGFRKDALEVTRRFLPTCIRWPGGCFVSDYHWQDGIGPVDQRPARLNRSWTAYTTNDVGMDEFVALCRKLGAEPYICVNADTASPEEVAALVEYCNGDRNTRWGSVRARNGNPRPYRIKTWNVGNEDYLTSLGGRRGKVYAQDFQAYARAMRAVDPSIELVAVGTFDFPRVPSDNPFHKFLRYAVDWNPEALPLLGRDMTYYSIHHYEPSNAVRGLSPKEITYAALASADDLAGKLDELHAEMDRYMGKRVPIALDEWAVWYPKEALGDKVPLPEGVKSAAEFGFHGTFLTLRDALAEAPVYNLMQRRPKDFALASRTLLYAYGLGLVGIGRDQVVASPSALMLALYATRERCQSLRMEAQGPTFGAPAKGMFRGAKAAPCLDVSARLRPDGKTAELFVVNRNQDDDLETMIEWRGKAAKGSIVVDTLNAASLGEWNSFKEPDRVKIVHSQAKVEGDRFHYRFPAHSVTKLTVRVQ